MKILYLIPARSGSKGLPGKNIKHLAGKPLIHYSIDAALQCKTSNDVVCVSTDSEEIQKISILQGADAPFLRPKKYSGDKSSSREVIIHALDWYKSSEDQNFDLIVLLQPTSPFRNSKHIKESLNKLNSNNEALFSVSETKANPYFTLYKNNDDGCIERYARSQINRRQDCPNFYELNGAIYIIRTEQIVKKEFYDLKNIAKYIMTKEDSIDIDDLFDFQLAEMIYKLKTAQSFEKF